MKLGKQLSVMLFCLLAAACVTVNVYFPAAAAEEVVDKFVQEVYGEVEGSSSDDPAQSKEVEEVEPEASLIPDTSTGSEVILSLVNFIIPTVMAAEPNIDIANPATNKLKGSMTDRHQQLAAFYHSGAVGMTGNALLVVRDAKAVSLKERNIVKQLVAEENRDRNQLYTEIAVANNHPEWEKQIRDLFARRWVANAPAGWWYDNGGWQQK